jgi:hypothetical protein
METYHHIWSLLAILCAYPVEGVYRLSGKIEDRSRIGEKTGQNNSAKTQKKCRKAQPHFTATLGNREDPIYDALKPQSPFSYLHNSDGSSCIIGSDYPEAGSKINIDGKSFIRTKLNW